MLSARSGAHQDTDLVFTAWPRKRAAVPKDACLSQGTSCSGEISRGFLLPFRENDLRLNEAKGTCVVVWFAAEGEIPGSAQFLSREHWAILRVLSCGCTVRKPVQPQTKLYSQLGRAPAHGATQTPVPAPGTSLSHGRGAWPLHHRGQRGAAEDLRLPSHFSGELKIQAKRVS